MANKKLSDGVGKKIVEALKKQSEIEITAKGSQDEAELTESFDVENASEQDAFSNDFPRIHDL